MFNVPPIDDASMFAVSTRSGIITPLGLLVLPEVNCKKQRSSGVTTGGVNGGATPEKSRSATTTGR